MTYYAPNNKEDLEKLKNLIEQKKDIKKLRLNRKIQKETLNKNLAEIYAPITKNQEKQTEIIKEGQENQLKAIQDQTDQIKAITSIPSTSALPEKSIPAIESSQSEDEFYDSPTQSIDSDIHNTSISSLINPLNSLQNFKFTKSDINNYKVNDKPFKTIDNKLIFDQNEIQITPSFFNLFIKNNKEDYLHLTRAEQIALPLFINYIGGLKKDRKSNLYKAVNYWQEQYNIDNVEGQGVSYVFLSSDPNILVKRLEILTGEYFAGNKNTISESEAILKELMNQNEINNQQYKNTMKLFTS